MYKELLGKRAIDIDTGLTGRVKAYVAYDDGTEMVLIDTRDDRGEYWKCIDKVKVSPVQRI